jgi:hypothetical protein
MSRPYGAAPSSTRCRTVGCLAGVYVSPKGIPSPFCRTHRTRTEDRRYHGSKWRRLAKIVVADAWKCWACPARATCADHINPVFPGMPDSDFYARRKLRGSCRRHNLQKGHAEALKRDLEQSQRTSRVISTDLQPEASMTTLNPVCDEHGHDDGLPDREMRKSHPGGRHPGHRARPHLTPLLRPGTDRGDTARCAK